MMGQLAEDVAGQVRRLEQLAQLDVDHLRDFLFELRVGGEEADDCRQQLRGRALEDRLREIIQAYRLTQALPPGDAGKQQIITAYLNQNFYGNQSYGIEAAAQSYFGKDVKQLSLAQMAILAAIPQPIRFMAKISLFKIPFFGWAIGKAGFIPIDRKNRRTAVKSFDLAAERIRRGNTIVIFPEEGRSREIAMRPFQRGAFLLALKSQLEMIPMAIDGTYNVFRSGATRVTPGRVTIRVGTPINCAGLTLRDKERLATESRAQISRMLFGEEEQATGDRRQATGEDDETEGA